MNPGGLRRDGVGGQPPLVRPSIACDEWWEGYVARTLVANGYVPKNRYMLWRMEPEVRQQFDEHRVSSHMAGRALSDLTAEYRGLAVPRWAVRGSESRVMVCPRCLAESPHIRLEWRLLAISECTIHALPLVGACLHCGAAHRPWDVAVDRCGCGRRISCDAETDVIDRSSGEARSAVSYRVSPLANEASELAGANAEISAKIFLAECLGEVGNVRARNGSHPWDKSDFQRLIEALELSGDVESIERLWPALPSAVHLRVALACVARIHHSEASERTILSELPLWKWAETLVELGAAPDRAERRGWIQRGQLKQRMLSIEATATACGMSVTHLHNLIGRGIVTPRRTFVIGVKLHLFSADQLQAISQFQPLGYGYGQALSLGLSTRSIYFLRLSGAICTIRDRHGRAWLAPEELRSVLNDLRRNAMHVSDAREPLVSFCSTAVWNARHAPSLGRVLKLMCQGALPVWFDGDAPGFDRYHVGQDVLCELYRKSRLLNPEQGEGAGQASLIPSEWLAAQTPLVGHAGRLGMYGGSQSQPIPRQQALQLALLDG